MNQIDFLKDEFITPQVFRFFGGAFIGRFNEEAQDDNEAEPVIRLSEVFQDEKEANRALECGIWPEPEKD